MRNVVVLRLLLVGSCWMTGAAIGCGDKGDPETSGSPKAISSKDGAKLEHCGKVVCREGRECCNESCGICTEADVTCTAQVCDTGEGVSSLAPQCGGTLELPCPGEGRCVDEGGAVCDPSDSDDCGGKCECAQSAKCPAGSRWNRAPQVCGCEVDDSARHDDDDDDNATAGSGGDDGEPPTGGPDAGGGEAGSQGEAGTGGGGESGSGGSGGSAGESGSGGGPVTCGTVTCASGQECCNESCSLCAPPGEVCTTQSCEPPMGGSMAPPPCGTTTCAAGQVCCDATCGLCAADSAECKNVACTDPGPHPGDLCDLRCSAGKRCEYVATTCIRPPCLPIAECVPFVECGGASGGRCPGAGSCVDDPSDACDPQINRECAGKCLCAGIARFCQVNFQWDNSPAVCACVPGPKIECIPELPCEI